MQEKDLASSFQAFGEESWSAYAGTNVTPQYIAAIDCCVFMDGNHYPGTYCIHQETTDEFGDVIEAGWTAQN